MSSIACVSPARTGQPCDPQFQGKTRRVDDEGFHRQRQALAKLLLLDSLECSGALAFRVWRGDSQVIELRSHADGRAEGFVLGFVLSNAGGAPHMRRESIAPDTVATLLQRVQAHRVAELRDDRDIEGYHSLGWVHGQTTVFELNEANGYAVYGYMELDRQTSDHPDLVDARAVMMLLEDELGLERRREELFATLPFGEWRVGVIIMSVEHAYVPGS